MSKFISRFLYILRGKRKELVILAFLFLLVSFMESVGIGLIGPFIAIATSPSYLEENSFLKLLYGHLGFTSSIQFLLVFGILLISIFSLKVIVSFIVQRSIFKFGFTVQGDLQIKLLQTYLTAPYTFHLSTNTANLTQSILNDTQVFCNNVLMPVLFATSNLTIIAGLVALLIFTNPLATFIIFGTLLIGYGLFYSLKDRLARWGKEQSESNAEMIRVINHSLGGFKETRVIGCEQYFDQQMQVQAQRYARLISNNLSVSILPRYVLEAFLMTFLILITLIFMASNQDDSQSLGSFLGIFAMASIRLLPTASNLIANFNGIRYANYAIDKIYFDLKELSRLDSTSTLSLPLLYDGVDNLRGVMPFTDSIVLEDVVYRYPTAISNALNQVSFRIQRGQSIGLIGRSGAGKTTMVDVILGLLTPQSGDIKVDGVSIYKDIRSWQNLVGYVPQSIFLMDDTLEKNIAFGVPEHLVDRQRLHAALESSQLLELVEQLPDGLKTVMGERGVRLSGGQRQRVGIARTLYHQREILVLDEATAALDNETEKLISESIKSLSGTKTIIIIAHRLSTIEHCDCVYMMEKGQVVKSGTYREVVSAS
jgi:ABC-type multidrug transport system fused ATPase/permease subunit